MIPETRKTHDVSPMIALVFCLEELLDLSAGRWSLY